jgi:hypothetical protein
MAAASLLSLTARRVHADNRASALQRRGVQADATVVAVDAQPVGRGQTLQGSVRLRFQAGGQTREATVYVGRAVGQYQPNQQVRVVYDPSDPMRVALLGKPGSARGVPPAALLGAAALLTAMALAAGRHVRQISHLVHHEPWQVVRSQLVQVPQSFGFRQGSRTLVVLDTPSGGLTVEPIGLSRVDARFAPQAWVVGLDAGTTVDTGTIVLAAPGGGHLVAVRRR